MNIENGMLHIQITNNALERANRALWRILSESPKAVARAVNRTMDGLRTDAVQETAKRYFMKPSELRAEKGKKYFSFRKATAGNLMGEMLVKGKRQSLANYKLTPSVPKPGAKVQLKGAVKREGGLKPLKGFLIRRASGKYFPFYRIGYSKNDRERGEIRAYISPSIPQIVKNEETIQAIEQGAEERFAKRLDHEYLHLLGVLP